MEHRYPPLPSLAELGIETPPAPPGKRRSGADLPKLKRFRFQLLADYVRQHFAPCRVADIAGGKGLFAHLLGQEKGWQATVIDPHVQPLPDKYTDLHTGRRVRIPPGTTVSRIEAPFRPELTHDFDLLVALHAHGCNLSILEGAAEYRKAFVLLPCCVIDEPAAPPQGLHWIRWLAGVAADRGFSPRFFVLNFKGQNIGFSAAAPRS
jgi:hypothetical protein